jgi:hypothetical protein
MESSREKVTLDYPLHLYHFVRYHESLREKLGEPIERNGKRQPQRYKKQTSASPALHRTQ